MSDSSSSPSPELQAAQLRMRSSYDVMVDAALDAIHRGYHVVPIRPYLKKPLFKDWQHVRWDDHANVTREQFVERMETEFKFAPGAAFNIGVNLGPASGNLVDVDIDYSKAKRFRDLLPRTLARSGRPGSPDSHFWYTIAPEVPGQPPTPSTRRYTLADKSTVTIEYRYDRSVQTVAPPSDWVPKDWDESDPGSHRLIEIRDWDIHGAWGGPAGPALVDGRQLAVQVALIALATALLDCWPASGVRHEAYLALGGALLRLGDASVHPFWENNAEVLIGALAEADRDDDGADSRVAETVPSTIDKIRNGKLVWGFPKLAEFIGQDEADHVRNLVAEVEALAGYQSRNALGPATAANRVTTPPPIPPASPQGPPPASGAPTPPNPAPKHSATVTPPPSPGDDGAPLDPAPEEVAAAEQHAEEVATSSWTRVDLEPYLNGQYVPTTPTMLKRDDGKFLIYPGRLNMLFAPSESAKTLIALYLCSEQMIEHGAQVVFIDFEDEPTNTIQRLRAMGVSDDLIRYNFSYIRPDQPIATMERDRWGSSAVTSLGQTNAEAFALELDRIEPTLIIADGMTSIYGLHGLDSNNSVDTEVINSWLKTLSRNEKTTVLLIDHMAKAQGKGAMPLGSQHKVSMIGGSLLQAWPEVQPVKGQVGTVELIILKDRNSEVRRHAALVNGKAQLAAVITIDSTGNNGESTVFTIGAPDKSATVNVGQAQPGQQAANGRTPKPKITAAQKAKNIAAQNAIVRAVAVQKLIISMFDQGISQAVDSKIFTNQLKTARTLAGYSEAETKTELLAMINDGTVVRTGPTRGMNAKFIYQKQYVNGGAFIV